MQLYKKTAINLKRQEYKQLVILQLYYEINLKLLLS